MPRLSRVQLEQADGRWHAMQQPPLVAQAINCNLFHISSKFDFFIGVDMVMSHALICVKEIHQSLT